jgi:antitoxin component of MazEF toxin-antitoxin module
MTTRIVRVGNSLIVEIPEELVAELGWQVGEPLEWVSIGNGVISLERAAPSAEAQLLRP